MNINKKKRSGIKALGIILFLFLLLLLSVPVTFNSLQSFSHEVRQKSQFLFIGIALEEFNSQFDHFPPSDQLDPKGIPYCGAMKLAEAMVGRDFMGFDPNSEFNSDGKDQKGFSLYVPTGNLNSRKNYLSLENARAYRIEDVYNNYTTKYFVKASLMLYDRFLQVTNLSTGQKVGMPILYYKADPNKSSHDIDNPDNPDNIYNYKDNYDLLALGVPGKPDKKHPLFEDPSLFYIITQNYNITSKSEPFNKDTYILISAGQDGLYGTSDDITNFDFKLRPKRNKK
jgi:hypothetical protein